MQNQTSNYDGPSCGRERLNNEDTNLPTTLYTKDAYSTTTGRSKLEHGPRTTNSPGIYLICTYLVYDYEKSK